MEFALGIIVGIPLGWVILLVVVVRWAIQAAEGDYADHTVGTAADRKVKGAP